MTRITHPDKAFDGAVGPVHFQAGVAETDDHSVVSYATLAGWKVEDSEEAAARDEEALRGKALDEALDAAGLSKAGTADEKRARLAEHEAAQPAPEGPAEAPAAEEAPDAHEAQDN